MLERQRVLRATRSPKRCVQHPKIQRCPARSRPLRLGELATDQNLGTFWSNPFVVQFSFVDSKYLTRRERNRLVALLYRERARKNQPSDRKRVPMPALAGTRSQVL